MLSLIRNPRADSYLKRKVSQVPKKPRTGICVYCGQEGYVTKDHVPPKCLFPPDTRVNLITVDACDACHKAYKLDDEYFRVTLAIRDDLPDGPGSQFIREQTRKTLSDPSATAFSAAIRAASVSLPRKAPVSDNIRCSTALITDANRIQRTCERIIRGLYGKFFDYPLPQSYELQVVLLDMQRNMSELEKPEVRDLLALLGEHGKHQVFGQVLNIWYAKLDKDTLSSTWYISIHGAFGFLGFTMPPE